LTWLIKMTNYDIKILRNTETIITNIKDCPNKFKKGDIINLAVGEKAKKKGIIDRELDVYCYIDKVNNSNVAVTHLCMSQDKDYIYFEKDTSQPIINNIVENTKDPRKKSYAKRRCSLYLLN